MAVEIFSRPNLHEKMCRTRGSIAVPLDSQATSLPTELERPAAADLCLCFRDAAHIIYLPQTTNYMYRKIPKFSDTQLLSTVSTQKPKKKKRYNGAKNVSSKKFPTITCDAKAPRIDIFFCIATKKRSISLQFKTNRRSRPSLPAFVCRMRTFKVPDLHRECSQHIFSMLCIQIFQTL